MEGLLIDQVLQRLRGVPMPLARGGWRFPDTRTLVLPLTHQEDALWIDLNPADPRLAWASVGPAEAPPTPFAALLAARALGDIACVEQVQLDRRLRIHFDAADGFVPQPSCVLEVELTGRNANAILTTRDGRILGAWREVGADVNRFRQVRSGGSYTPPPPYQKMDPRTLDPQRLPEVLGGEPPRSWHRRLDGVGPKTLSAWAAAAAVDPHLAVPDDAWPRVITALQALLRDPAAFVQLTDVAAQRTQERRARTRERLTQTRREALRKAERQLADLERLLAQGERVSAAQREADLLLAFAGKVPAGAARVTLEGFDGAAQTILLDPSKSVHANAQLRYERAKRWRARAERAEALRPNLQQALARAQSALLEVAALQDADLDRLAAQAATADRSAARAARAAPKVGIRLQAPHGFEVVVGRNARENDAVTFSVGRSLDVWLHAQGVRGAHVVVRSGGRELPSETLRFAAALAAGHAEVGDESTVLVDYTLRKHVWKVKGMPPGAVHYTQQRTLAVTPMRASAVDSPS